VVDNAMSVAIDPPLVRIPPAESGYAKRLASHVMTFRSMTLAAGDNCQKLQFWLIVAATASANGAKPLGGPSTYARNLGCASAVRFGKSLASISLKRDARSEPDSGNGSDKSPESWPLSILGTTGRCSSRPFLPPLCDQALGPIGETTKKTRKACEPSEA